MTRLLAGRWTPWTPLKVEPGRLCFPWLPSSLGRGAVRGSSVVTQKWFYRGIVRAEPFDSAQDMLVEVRIPHPSTGSG